MIIMQHVLCPVVQTRSSAINLYRVEIAFMFSNISLTETSTYEGGEGIGVPET